MLHGVYIEIDGVSKHSGEWGLEFISYSLNFPEIKKTTVDIEGANGELDLTDVYGHVFYKNRKLTLNFNAKRGFNRTVRDVVSFVHGKVAKITIFDDENYYYVGRMEFNKYTSDFKIGKVIFNVNCEPYKYRQDRTVETHEIKGEKAVNYKCDYMETMPDFTSDQEMSFEFNGKQYSLPSGQKTTFTGLTFTEGDNFIKWKGNGKVTVTYQEGTL